MSDNETLSSLIDRSRLLYLTVFFQYLIIFLTTIGLILNALTFIIFQRRRFHNASFAFYFSALLISDSLLLLQHYRIFAIIVLNKNLDEKSIVLCKIADYLEYISGSVSTWMISIILLDRLVTIAYSQRFRIVRKKSFQITLVFLVVTYSSIFYLTIPIFKQIIVVQKTTNFSFSCSYGNRHQAFIVYLTDFINITAGNLIVNNILTALTLHQIRRSRKRTHNRAAPDNIRDRKFAINSIVLNIVIFIFETPVLIILIVNNYLNQESDLLFSIGVLFFTFKCSSSFIVNMCTNSIFYSEFRSSFANNNLRLVKFVDSTSQGEIT